MNPHFKPKSLIIQAVAATAVAMLPLGALGQQTDPNKQRSANPSVNTPPVRVPAGQTPHAGAMETLGPVTRASELIGKDLKNAANERIAEVKDLVLDASEGRILHVIIGSGGVVGVGEKLHLVPPALVKVGANEKVYQLGVDKERLANAPEFNAARWDELSVPDRIAEVDRYYGQEPRSWLNRTTPGTAVTERRTVTKASQMIGSTVKNNLDEKVGSIDDLIVDLNGSRLVQVIVSSGGFLGVGDELNAVPPMAFRYDATAKTWFLDVTKEQLTAAPRFKASEWPNFGDPTYAGGVYRAYRVEPYFSADRRTEETLKNAGDQSNRESDLAVTRRIRQEIVARDGLSLNARNVKIITSDGSVTLRGPVSSEEERRTIADIARQYAAGNRVENLLEVKGEKKNF